MAKQPETVEICRIHADTTLDQMGHVLAALARMGLQNVGYELVTEISTFKQKQSHNTTAVEFTTEWVTEHPTFDIRELVAAFRADGRTAGSAYTAARVMVVDKVLRKVGPGNYQRADVKALAAPAKENGRLEKSNRDFLWEVIGKRKSFTSLDLTRAFQDARRSVGSMSSVLSKLIKSKEVKRTGDRQYAVLGRKAPDAYPGKQRAPNPVSRYEVSNKDMILQHIKNRKKVTVAELEEVFTAQKRNPTSVSAVFSKLTADGVMKKDGQIPGLYHITKNNKPTPPATAPVPNGRDITEEAAHG